MSLYKTLRLAVAWAALIASFAALSHAEEQDRAPEKSISSDARQGLLKAIRFFANEVAVHGGYVYQASEDLRYREGEGDAGLDTVWVQPPGTPAVGLALVKAYQRTREETCLDAALAAADCLRKGQLHSGGWANHIVFDPAQRSKFAYRFDGPPKKKAKNHTSFDDDQTQAAIRFLVTLDEATNFANPQVHETATTALAAVVASQYSCGAWPQGFNDKHDPTAQAVLHATYPDAYPREHPGEDYWQYYTLNDNAMLTVANTLLLASKVYNDPIYLESAKRAGDFLLLAVMPEPQPAWAQQYNFEMHPVWARRFEPPAISGSESQSAIRLLMQLYIVTGEDKYLAPVSKAVSYLQRSRLEDGKLARFYELRTNKPLFFTKDYKLTYSSDNVPDHYSFTVKDSTSDLQAEFERLRVASNHDRQKMAGGLFEDKFKRVSDDVVIEVISEMDDRGAWVEDGKLRYIKAQDFRGRVIRSETFIKNIDLLSLYVEQVAAPK